MIEVHLLRYALAAAETGSFSQAADLFRVKQSTLSKRISYLEQRLGLSIFTRSTQGVAPTRSGLHFLAQARSIVDDLERLSCEAHALAAGHHGTLRIGFHASLAGGDLRAILDSYRATFPEVKLEALEGGREMLLGALDHDRIDIAIVAGDSASPALRSLTLWSEPLMVGLPSGHRLAQIERLYWTDLRGLAFLVTQADPGSLIAAMIAARMAGPGTRPTITVQAVSRDNLPSFVDDAHASVTAGALPSFAATRLREVHDAFGATRIDQTILWHDTNRNPALARFLSLIEQRYGCIESVAPEIHGRAATRGET